MKQFFAGQSQVSQAIYSRLFGALSEHPTPRGQPKYGLLLEAYGKVVGGIILISTKIRDKHTSYIRCHLTSLYVEPEFRGYGAFLMIRAKCNPEVTYINLTALTKAQPIIEAQGFMKYCYGQFYSLSFINALMPSKESVRVVPGGQVPDRFFEQHEYDLLSDHLRYGCICFWCVTNERAHPFVFRRGRRVKALLVYCHDIADIERFAKQIGIVLARNGRLLMEVDANGPMKGLIGRYVEGFQPRWYKGLRPRLGDLAYTRTAMFP